MKCRSNLVSVSRWSKGFWLGALAVCLEREFWEHWISAPFHESGAGLPKQGWTEPCSSCPGSTPVSLDRGGEGGASSPATHFGQQDTLSAGDPSHYFLSGKQELPGVLGLKDVGVTLSLHMACQALDCSSEQRCHLLTVGSRSH